MSLKLMRLNRSMQCSAAPESMLGPQTKSEFVTEAVLLTAMLLSENTSVRTPLLAPLSVSFTTRLAMLKGRLLLWATLKMMA